MADRRRQGDSYQWTSLDVGTFKDGVATWSRVAV